MRVAPQLGQVTAAGQVRRGTVNAGALATGPADEDADAGGDRYDDHAEHDSEPGRGGRPDDQTADQPEHHLERGAGQGRFYTVQTRADRH